VQNLHVFTLAVNSMLSCTHLVKRRNSIEANVDGRQHFVDLHWRPFMTVVIFGNIGRQWLPPRLT